MDDELLEGLAREVAQQIARVRVDLRREFAELAAVVQRAATAEAAALRERLSETSQKLELALQAVEVLRSEVGDPVVAFSRDAEGGVQLLQRHGPPRALPLPDVTAIATAAVEALGAGLREALIAEAHAQVARTFELFCNAPVWSEKAVYTEGQIVQTDVGRSYRVRQGIRATIGRVPGDDTEHWERLGTGGFRLLKSKPAALAPGDVFTEHDARFMHDGQTTILLVPKAAKVSDIERAVKGPHNFAQATQAELRELAARVTGLLSDVQRNAKAANDAGELGVQALALMERLSRDVDAMQRRLDALAASGGSA